MRTASRFAGVPKAVVRTAIWLCASNLLVAAAPPSVRAQTVAGGDAARIQGKIVDPGGAPVAGATVFYNRIRKAVRTPDGRVRPAPGEPYIYSSAAAAADGSFAVRDLPAGEYSVCAEASGFLNTCNWSSPLRFTVAEGAVSDLGVIPLTRGALLQIRVNDPAGLIPDENPMFAPLVVGIRAGGRFIAARQVSKDAAGKTLAVLVPYGVPLKLWLYSWKVQLTDARGASLDSAGTNIPLIVATGTTPSTIELNVVDLLAR